MRTLLYGPLPECLEAVQILCALAPFSDPQHRFVFAHTYDELHLQLAVPRPSMAIILADRADGMEGVYLVRQRFPNLPVFWFSDDAGFGMQSHRLECDYFAVKPLTVCKIQRALSRCRHVGISLGHSFFPNCPDGTAE